jgi:chromosome partitioning protein
MLEVRALSNATAEIRRAQSIRHGVPNAVIVLSMVGKHYRLTKDMKDAAIALSLPMASTALTLRQIYADAPGQGNVVWQMGARSGDASNEIDHLFRELLPDACSDRKAKRITTRIGS